MNTTNSAVRRWRKIIREQRASGLSVAEFCRRARVSTWSFYSWRLRLRAERQAEDKFVEVQAAREGAGAVAIHDAIRLSSPPFGAAQIDKGCLAAVSPTGEAGGLELHLPGRRCLVVRRGFDRETLLNLLNVLEASAAASSTDRPSVALDPLPVRQESPTGPETEPGSASRAKAGEPDSTERERTERLIFNLAKREGRP
jgi:hypothetical protein